jgi:hypothetical protein
LFTQPLVVLIPGQASINGFPLPIQTIAPVGQARWVMPQLQLSFPRAQFSCLGVTASYEILSDVSG